MEEKEKKVIHGGNNKEEMSSDGENGDNSNDSDDDVINDMETPGAPQRLQAQEQQPEQEQERQRGAHGNAEMLMEVEVCIENLIDDAVEKSDGTKGLRDTLGKHIAILTQDGEEINNNKKRNEN